MRTRFHRTMLATASLAVVGLLASGCGAQGPSAAQSPTAEDSAGGTATPSSPAEPSPSAGESEPTQGVTFYDEPGGWREDRQGRSPAEGEVRGSARAPNGESWPVDAVIDLAQLEAEPSGEAPASSEADPVDCVQDWSDTQYLWLRDKTGWEAPLGSGVSDYRDGPQAGPTCLGSPGGAVSGPDHRLIHFICQAANTTARTLVAPYEGGQEVWTPEYTTAADERQCFTFGGEEVRAYQTEVSAAE